MDGIYQKGRANVLSSSVHRETIYTLDSASSCVDAELYRLSSI